MVVKDLYVFTNQHKTGLCVLLDFFFLLLAGLNSSLHQEWILCQQVPFPAARREPAQFNE